MPPKAKQNSIQPKRKKTELSSDGPASTPSSTIVDTSSRRAQTAHGQRRGGESSQPSTFTTAANEDEKEEKTTSGKDSQHLQKDFFANSQFQQAPLTARDTHRRDTATKTKPQPPPSSSAGGGGRKTRLAKDLRQSMSISSAETTHHPPPGQEESSSTNHQEDSFSPEGSPNTAPSTNEGNSDSSLVLSSTSSFQGTRRSSESGGGGNNNAFPTTPLATARQLKQAALEKEVLDLKQQLASERTRHNQEVDDLHQRLAAANEEVQNSTKQAALLGKSTNFSSEDEEAVALFRVTESTSRVLIQRMEGRAFKLLEHQRSVAKGFFAQNEFVDHAVRQKSLDYYTFLVETFPTHCLDYLDLSAQVYSALVDDAVIQIQQEKIASESGPHDIKFKIKRDDTGCIIMLSPFQSVTGTVSFIIDTSAFENLVATRSADIVKSRFQSQRTWAVHAETNWRQDAETKERSARKAILKQFRNEDDQVMAFFPLLCEEATARVALNSDQMFCALSILEAQEAAQFQLLQQRSVHTAQQLELSMEESTSREELQRFIVQEEQPNILHRTLISGIEPRLRQCIEHQESTEVADLFGAVEQAHVTVKEAKLRPQLVVQLETQQQHLLERSEIGREEAEERTRIRQMKDRIKRCNLILIRSASETLLAKRKAVEEAGRHFDDQNRTLASPMLDLYLNLPQHMAALEDISQCSQRARVECLEEAVRQNVVAEYLSALEHTLVLLKLTELDERFLLTKMSRVIVPALSEAHAATISTLDGVKEGWMIDILAERFYRRKHELAEFELAEAFDAMLPLANILRQRLIELRYIRFVTEGQDLVDAYGRALRLYERGWMEAYNRDDITLREEVEHRQRIVEGFFAALRSMIANAQQEENSTRLVIEREAEQGLMQLFMTMLMMLFKLQLQQKSSENALSTLLRDERECRLIIENEQMSGAVGLVHYLYQLMRHRYEMLAEEFERFLRDLCKTDITDAVIQEFEDAVGIKSYEPWPTLVNGVVVEDEPLMVCYITKEHLRPLVFLPVRIGTPETVARQGAVSEFLAVPFLFDTAATTTSVHQKALRHLVSGFEKRELNHHHHSVASNEKALHLDEAQLQKMGLRQTWKTLDHFNKANNTHHVVGDDGDCNSLSPVLLLDILRLRDGVYSNSIPLCLSSGQVYNDNILGWDAFVGMSALNVEFSFQKPGSTSVFKGRKARIL